MPVDTKATVALVAMRPNFVPEVPVSIMLLVLQTCTYEHTIDAATVSGALLSSLTTCLPYSKANANAGTRWEAAEAAVCSPLRSENVAKPGAKPRRTMSLMGNS